MLYQELLSFLNQDKVYTLTATIFVFSLLIFIHEFGHFISAKLVGIKVFEFSLGFGPKLLSFMYRETMYCLRLLPLGGFCRLAGMEDETNKKEYTTKESFKNKSIFQRGLVLSAGSVMNLLLAVILLAFVLSLQGIPQKPTTVIDKIIENSPSEKIGLLPGDKIISVDGQLIKEWNEAVTIISKKQNHTITVNRRGIKKTFTVVAEKDKEDKYKIGITSLFEYKKFSFPKAIIEAGKYTGKISYAILNYLYQVVHGNEKLELGGPVRIAHESGKAASLGIFALFQFTAFISINLGLFNLFPVPALDGGHLLLLGIEGIRRRPINPKIEYYFNYVGIQVLIFLVVLITIFDIANLI